MRLSVTRTTRTQWVVGLAFKLSVLLLMTGSVYGQARCTPTPLPSANRDNQASETAALKKEISLLKDEIKTLKENIDVLKFQLEFKQDKQESTLLSTDDRGFGRVDTESGNFLVSLEEATPYLDGYKARFNIGTLSPAAYTGVKLKLTWYPRGKFYPSKSKEESLIQCLAPSRWNSVEVILPNTKPDELGSISVAMETKTVSFVCRN